jgi:GTPase Era involved in 16S rRNA processing
MVPIVVGSRGERITLIRTSAEVAIARQFGVPVKLILSVTDRASMAPTDGDGGQFTAVRQTISPRVVV